MRLTEKGQVTIPARIREELGLRPGDEVEFEVVPGGARLARAAGQRSRGRRVVDHLLGKRADVPMSTDEIMELTRDA